MQSPIHAKLQPVRQRQQQVFALRSAVLGLLGSSLVGVSVGVWRWSTGSAISPALTLALLLAGPVVGLIVGFVWRRTWQSAAAAIDDHYRLKDRSLTALSLLTRPVDSAWLELQVDDALAHLSKVEPNLVVPFRLPRAWPVAIGTLAVALGLLLWPLNSSPVEAGTPAPIPGIVAEAEKIEEDLKEFEELAKQEENKELEELVKELRELVEEMKQPGVDSREALAKLSEMQAAIQAQQAQYNVALVDGQLQSLGAALALAESTENAGKALVDGKFNKAVEELEKLEEPEFDRKEAKALAEKLKKTAKELGDLGLGQLSDAASEMCEGLEGKSGKFQSGTRSLAKQVQKHDRRKKIDELLCKECDKLCECKCNCEKNSLVTGLNPVKSLSPSNSFGMKTSGNVKGEKTDSAGKTNLEQITGQQGEGPSEIETTHSVEGRQQATREYREAYQKYQKLSESVLDSEPIPLGHRQTIRKYFELIRPQQADETKAAP